MRKIILQHCTAEQECLFDISRPINEAYAKKFGFEYVVTSGFRLCPEKSFYWEKIACLRKFLPTVEEGTLVVWEDVDTVNLGDEDFVNALPTNGILGMVQLRCGLDNKRLQGWYNVGVMVMKNSPIIRDFFERVALRDDETDESAVMAELRHNDWVVGDGIKVSGLNSKWNCWQNNSHITTNLVTQSWHGLSTPKKLAFMQKSLVKV